MSTHKYIDRVCIFLLVLSLLLTLAFFHAEALGIQPSSQGMGYETRLFDTTRVHTIDIVMDDWDTFLATCEDEEYVPCAVVIDGEAYQNVGLRAKGNTSLSAVSAMNSDRYSFKIEFDQYDTGKRYYGLDKLSLNNAIQDATYMKDYLTYRMMAAFGVDAPLCSYAWITVNGADWGLYLAVEGVEDAFLQRNYGTEHGALYKPDSMSFGGGRGNGRDFDVSDLAGSGNSAGSPPAPPEGSGGTGSPQQPSLPDGAPDQAPSDAPGQAPAPSPGGHGAEEGGARPAGGFGGMGSDDVKLQYIDDDPDSYPNIFDNAKTAVTNADQNRLIQSLNALSAKENLADVLDVDEVIRYFVVHNFVVNGDSYTGSMVHNYYLYEENGRLSMIPWDYNLAFGTFQASSAATAVNDPIDTPLSVTGSGDRPMADWIFSSESYTQQYHQYFAQFLQTVDCSALIDEAAALIAPYVERDPTKFYQVEEFEAGVAALHQFCLLRAESVAGQLDGAIPATASGQAEQPDTLVDASQLNLSDMGTMDGGFPAGTDRPQASSGALPEEPATNGQDNQLQPPQWQQPSGQADNSQPGGRGDSNPAGTASPPQAWEGPALLAASVLILLLGLVIAVKFKR